MRDDKRLDPETLLTEVELRKWIRRNLCHYSYVLCKPSGVPFYVGKGSPGPRVLCHLRDATNTSEKTHKLNTIRKVLREGGELLYSVSPHDSHSEALAAERALISKIGRYDLSLGPLTNQTDGGEGALNPSEESKSKHRKTLAGYDGNDDDRNTANRIFAGLVRVGSVPVKPTNGRYKVEHLFRNRNSFGFSRRMAGALIVSARSHKILLAGGADVPRRFDVGGTEMIIENGCGRDMLSSGLVDLSDITPKHEVLRLSPGAVEACVKWFGHKKLVVLGVLED